MILLRELRNDDILTIKAWPPYPQDCMELDYSLRNGGWLDKYLGKPGTEILVATDSESIAGFSILEHEPGRRAEFRIALHPGKLGQGLGKTIAILTLAHGFSDPGTDVIRLIVRKNNPRAQRLYSFLKFRGTGECTEEVEGKMVEFYTMEIDRKTFRETNRI
ncbi:GNAT family protein [uncultured Methanoregula sp.]|uniref:GNAT family N-acetyltransferase n=1 Tax=uncultured Methanoregula sp. TaxID=1005933 RepID=UPI002AAB046D|nr:GNAT family protein [uncultured Methanoregula sp.]